MGMRPVSFSQPAQKISTATGELVPDYGNYSFGTGPAIQAIQKELLNNNSKYDTVLVNIATLIRNRVEKELPTSQLLEMLDLEVKDLISDLVSVLQSKANGQCEPLVLLYLYDYSKMIPKENQKETHAKTSEVISALTSRIFKLISSNNTIRNGVRVLIVVTNDQTIPSYKHLSRMIYNQRNAHHILMVSHYPLDYHMARKLPVFSLVNSHTGTLVPANKLGEKVFDNPFLPFNTYTHALLGDKPLIKNSLDRASKKSLIGIAEMDRWSVKTADYIKDKLLAHSFHPPFSLD